MTGNMVSFINILVFLSPIAFVLCGERKVQTGDLDFDVIGKSGKMRLGKKGKNAIEILMDEIIETDVDGNRVGAKHGFKNFAKTDFRFGSITNTSKYKVEAKRFSFTARLPVGGKDATLKVITYMFQKNGTAEGENGESYEVTKGALKFNIELENWNFCLKANSGCSADGKYLDFVMQFKTKSVKKPERSKKQKGRRNHKGKRSPETRNFGGIDGTFSSQLNSDGNWVDMAENYPMVEVKKNKVTVTFRFPKCVKKCYYDPVLEVGSDSVEASGIMATGSFVVMLVSLFVITVTKYM